MEVAAVACRAGLLARARPSSRARAWAWEHGVAVGPAPSAARRRLLVASLGVGEPVPAQSLGEEAVALEVGENDLDSIVSVENLPPAAAHVPEARRAVRVRFVLRKQCAFGQQFLVAGDDAALGLWDPAKAISLVWSEGHVWTANADLPANRSIEFKFLLRDASGHVHWQHGANRTLRITETPNTVVVHEDWDHGNKQSVSEEEELSIGEDVMFSEDLAGTNGAMPADTAENPEEHQNLETDRPAAVVADAPLQGGMVEANGTETDQPQLVVDEHQTILEEVPGGQNGTLSADDYAGNGSNDDDDDTILYQGGDLLPNRPTGIFENDLAWAGKAMQQLLRILGFQIGTTRT